MLQNMATAVHLITVLYNCEATLPAFLRSLRAQTLSDWRLIAVDNASQDGSRALVTAEGDPRIHLLCNPCNLGFARAANQGLRVAAGEGGQFFILLNNDTVFAPEFLDQFIGIRHRLGAAVMAPRIMLRSDPERSWYAGGHLDDGWILINIHDPYDPADAKPFRRVDFATGCCLGLAREVLDTVGLFDERFFMYWEDADLCLRLKATGIPIVYVRDPSLLHEAGASSGGEFSPAYSRLYYRSYIQLLRKHFGIRHALVTMYRLIGREMSRPTRHFHVTSGMAAAMIAGLLAPSRSVGRLEP